MGASACGGFGVVYADPANRTLIVRLSDRERGGVRHYWREAWVALRQAQEAGWPGDTPRIWASTDSEREVVPGTVGDYVDGGLLKFHFPIGTGGE